MILNWTISIEIPINTIYRTILKDYSVYRKTLKGQFIIACMKNSAQLRLKCELLILLFCFVAFYFYLLANLLKYLQNWRLHCLILMPTCWLTVFSQYIGWLMTWLFSLTYGIGMDWFWPSNVIYVITQQGHVPWIDSVFASTD